MKSSSKKSHSTPCDTIGDLLKISREQNGLTQKEVASKLKISEMFVSNMELNKCGVPLKHLKKFIFYYKIDAGKVIKLHLRQERTRLEKALK